MSRITAGRALDELARAGLAVRRRRVGTTVSYAAPESTVEADLEQALDTLIAFGRGTQVKVLALATLQADATIAAALNLVPGEPVVEAIRMRERDGEPLGRVTSHAIAALAPILTCDALLHEPLLALVQAAGHRIGSGTETVAARAADEEIAAALRIEWRQPLLTIERITRDTTGRPLLRTVAEYRADRYRLSLQLKHR